MFQVHRLPDNSAFRCGTPPRLVSSIALLALAGATACFSPVALPLEEDESEAGSSGETGDTPGGSGTGVEPTGATGNSVETDGDGGSDGPSPECESAADCDAGSVCIDGECGSCSDADGPDQACADADFSMPICGVDGQCVACEAETCSGDTPVCNPGTGCAACTEHSDCPESACHLYGPHQGSCFEASDVVDVYSGEELQAAVSGVGNGSQRVIRLAPGSYAFSQQAIIAGEVALLGQPGAVVTVGASTNMLQVYTDETPRIFYLSGINIDGGGLGWRAISCGGTDNVLAIDDTSISGYLYGINTGCETHVRRSHFSSIEGDATFESIAVQVSNATFEARNSSVGPGADIGINHLGGEMRLLYSTIAGNAESINCEDGVNGEVRNSILVGTQPSSVDNFCPHVFTDNAVDTGSGVGEAVGIYDSSWFVDPEAGDFHLSDAGQAVFADIADWDEGDPLVDIDGDPRPQDAPGYPGVDEVP